MLPPDARNIIYTRAVLRALLGRPFRAVRAALGFFIQLVFLHRISLQVQLPAQ